MIKIEFGPDEESAIAALLAEYPDHLSRVGSRNSIGGGHDFSLLMPIAALAIPAFKAAIIELIRAKQFKKFSCDGLNFTGYDADEIVKIIDAKSAGAAT